MGLDFVNQGVKPWADQIAPGQRGQDSTGMPMTLESNGDRLARFEKDYWAPDRDQVLANMQQPQTASIPQNSEGPGGITGEMQTQGPGDIQPLPESQATTPAVPTSGTIGPTVLSPGANGMWSADGGKPGSVASILQQMASRYGGGMGGALGTTGGVKPVSKMASALDGTAPTGGSIPTSGKIGDSVGSAALRLATDASMIPLGSIGKAAKAFGPF